jgi:hypothetical protein
MAPIFVCHLFLPLIKSSFMFCITSVSFTFRLILVKIFHIYKLNSCLKLFLFLCYLCIIVSRSYKEKNYKSYI